jgi:hypothetical protein
MLPRAIRRLQRWHATDWQYAFVKTAAGELRLPVDPLANVHFDVVFCRLRVKWSTRIDRPDVGCWQVGVDHLAPIPAFAKDFDLKMPWPPSLTKTAPFFENCAT